MWSSASDGTLISSNVPKYIFLAWWDTDLQRETVDVPGSVGMTSTNITVDPAMPALFYRLIGVGRSEFVQQRTTQGTGSIAERNTDCLTTPL
jgi:hypothetical protein